MSALESKVEVTDCCLDQEEGIRFENVLVKEEPGISNMVLEDEEELKPPVAVWVKEEPREQEEDVEGDKEELKPPVAVWVKEEPEEQEDVEGDKDPLLGSNQDAHYTQVEEEEELSPQGECSLGYPWEPQSSSAGATGHREENASHATGDGPQNIKTSPCHSQALSGQMYECEVCKKRFPKKCRLDYHMRVHTGEKPFQCSVCGKFFSLKDSLNKHMRTHTGDKPHQCNVCQKSFSFKCSLNLHMSSHTGEKSYQCSMCQKNYKRKNNLNIHMLSHTGEKSHVCTVCQKRFSAKDNLIQHMRRHTGEKPFKCSVCGKAFRCKSNIYTDTCVHTQEKNPTNVPYAEKAIHGRKV